MNQSETQGTSGRLSIKLTDDQRTRIDAYVRSVAEPGMKSSVASVVEAALDEFLHKRGV